MILNTREQQLRKQAELQTSFASLANLRTHEASYIENSIEIPEVLLRQIDKTRQEIHEVIESLIDLKDETTQPPGYSFYQMAFAEELAGNLAKAAKLYRSAARHKHPDAGAAIQSVRYRLRISNNSSLIAVWSWSPRNLLLISLTMILLVLGLLVVLMVAGRPPKQEPFAIKIEATARPTLPLVVVIVPNTATPTPTATSTPTLLPSHTPTPVPTITPSSQPVEIIPAPGFSTPTLSLRTAPKIIDPPNGLVWKDGAVVFEFENLNLAHDELYCLATLKGYDESLAERWSFPPTGGVKPAIPVKAKVFHIAKTQGIRCIVWSAYIGRGTCESIISHRTEERIIGLPQPCPYEAAAR